MNFLTEKMQELAEKRKAEFARMEREMQELRDRIEIKNEDIEANEKLEELEKIKKIKSFNGIFGRFSK